jgi:ribonuclease E
MSEPIPSDAVVPPSPELPIEVTASADVDADGVAAAASSTVRKKRRRGSRGGRNRRPAASADGDGAGIDAADDEDDDDDVEDDVDPHEPAVVIDDDRQPELPDRISEGRPRDPEVAERVLVPRKPQIGDTMPAPPRPPAATAPPVETPARRRRRRGGRGRGTGAAKGPGQPVTADVGGAAAVDLDEETLARQRGRERKGRPIGRYLMCVHVRPGATQIAVLEGRSLIEHYVSKPADDPTQIHGNIYLGRVQNVLPGMEAAFVDIGTPKNAVLYRGDLQYDQEDIVERGANARIEQILKPRQTILCQVTKNPIGAKGARLTQEVSLPGRSVVLIPNSSTYGISKRLHDDERKRLRGILDRVKPAQHGVIVRTAAEGITTDEIERDVIRLVNQWEQIEALAKRSAAPALLYTEPSMAVRVIREEFNREYRGVVIDEPVLFEAVKDYVASISPALADRVEFYDAEVEGLPLFERHHVHEQLHKALDRKVWLPSGGSLIIEHTEALTVIDVNTGKNVGTSSLEETVFRNNLEAADEIARQLRLRDIGGIIVIDFIDMEIRENRHAVIAGFRDALARDKTRTQVFEISELGLVEMTRKRIGEGLLESFAETCPHCEGRGVIVDHELIE